VTFDQFKAFAQEAKHAVASSCNDFDPINGVQIKLNASFWYPGFMQAGDHPAVCVSWRDAKAYVTWLSQKLGKGYRLATETEWEYVARAGSQARYHFGEDEARLCEFGNV